VIVCSRTQSEIDSVVEKTNSVGNGQIIGRKCDVSVFSQVNNIVNEALEIYGRVDVLVNNVAITYVKKLIDEYYCVLFRTKSLFIEFDMGEVLFRSVKSTVAVIVLGEVDGKLVTNC
jgi:NAD(P)-dependent dehydrogenase (short-subunit alcohol dehydrogenase family)